MHQYALTFARPLYALFIVDSLRISTELKNHISSIDDLIMNANIAHYLSVGYNVTILFYKIFFIDMI